MLTLLLLHLSRKYKEKTSSDRSPERVILHDPLGEVDRDRWPGFATPGKVGLDGTLGNAQPCGNLFAALTMCYPGQYFSFALGQFQATTPAGGKGTGFIGHGVGEWTVVGDRPTSHPILVWLVFWFVPGER